MCRSIFETKELSKNKIKKQLMIDLYNILVFIIFYKKGALYEGMEKNRIDNIRKRFYGEM